MKDPIRSYEIINAVKGTIFTKQTLEKLTREGRILPSCVQEIVPGPINGYTQEQLDETVYDEGREAEKRGQPFRKPRNVQRIGDYTIFELDFVVGGDQTRPITILTDGSQRGYSHAFGGIKTIDGGRILRGKELEKAIEYLRENNLLEGILERGKMEV